MAKRRANGEGNLRKRKDGRWEGRYTAGHDPETGKAIYRNEARASAQHFSSVYAGPYSRCSLGVPRQAPQQDAFFPALPAAS